MKPILFNTEMVRAILDGRKTQTRRVVNPDWIQSEKLPISLQADNGLWHFWCSGEHKAQYCIGDILYVRETFVIGVPDGTMPESDTNPITVFYKADNSIHGWMDENEDECNIPWKPSIHMPKEYARIFLKVTNVRVERLQDMPHDDVYAEGFPDDFYKKGGENFRHWFVDLWNSTAKDGHKWEDNPYVFVYEFERVKNETL